MNFAVVWMPDAQNELATIWLAATDRNAVTRASHTIDLLLGTAPHTVGTVLFDTLREYMEPPLGVEFEVIDADRRVFVLTCWDTSSGRPTPTGNGSLILRKPEWTKRSGISRRNLLQSYLCRFTVISSPP